ncbi:MAG: spore germination protein [Pseudomonadota bacterium]
MDDGLLSTDIHETITRIKLELGSPSDLLINLNESGKHGNLKYASIYIENIVDKSSINSLSAEIAELLKSIDMYEGLSPDGYLSMLRNTLSCFRRHEEGTSFNSLCDSIITGKTILLIDRCDRFFSIDNFSAEGRNVTEPTSQSLVRGPKEGFTEDLSVNISLIRKRVKSKALRIEDHVVGTITKTRIALMYIDKLARQDVVDEMRRRLMAVRIDGILDSGYIEELIKDDRYSIFPTFLNSEKPDSVVAEILEGKVAVLVDGTAYVLTAPALFVQFLQSSEDYYHQFAVSSVIRITRYLAFLLTLVVPAAYIALVTFHQEMIPTPLLISLASQREGVPFPALAEALMMEGIFEILREAGIRMPRIIGPAISIVGALVLGQAAVEAGVISAFMVIVVSITAISSFAIPNYSMANAIRLIRFTFMILAGVMGLYGVFMGLNIMILHLCKLKSMGLPYMTPIAPKGKHALKDTFLRYPLWSNRFRPDGITGSDSPRINASDPMEPSQKSKQEFREKK